MEGVGVGVEVTFGLTVGVTVPVAFAAPVTVGLTVPETEASGVFVDSTFVVGVGVSFVVFDPERDPI